MTVQRIKLAEMTAARLQALQTQYAGRNMDVEVVIAESGSDAVESDRMNETNFWQIIAALGWDNAGNDDAVIEPAVQLLSTYSPQAIKIFYDLLSEKLYLLDGRIYAQYSTSNDESFSADLFLYARCGVVANGQKVFENVLNNPAQFPKDRFFEAILDIPERAWFRKTGKNIDFLPKYMFETGFNPNGWGSDTIVL